MSPCCAVHSLGGCPTAYGGGMCVLPTHYHRHKAYQPQQPSRLCVTSYQNADLTKLKGHMVALLVKVLGGA